MFLHFCIFYVLCIFYSFLSIFIFFIFFAFKKNSILFLEYFFDFFLEFWWKYQVSISKNGWIIVLGNKEDIEQARRQKWMSKMSPSDYTVQTMSSRAQVFEFEQKPFLIEKFWQNNFRIICYGSLVLQVPFTEWSPSQQSQSKSSSIIS